MAQSPERPEAAPPQPAEGLVKEVPESPEVTPSLTEVGVTAVPTQVTQQVTDDTTGQPLIQTPATHVVTITIPATPTQLSDWSKGSPSDSLTWLATFWLRIVKKAMHFGWRVITQKGAEQ